MSFPNGTDELMKRNRILARGLSLAFAVLLAASAQAAIITFDFADPVADTPTSAFAACGGGQDRCATTLTFTKDGLAVTASGTGAAGAARAIIQDLDPDRGGLGVIDSLTSHGNDNVSRDETIVLTFSSPVLLNAVRFFDDHEPLPHSFPNGSNFFFTVDEALEVDKSLAGALGPDGRELDFGGLLGTTFYFRHAGQNKDDFYISGLVVETQEEAPEPGTLLILGAGLLGLTTRFRPRS
jgi:hypothetical protein